MTRTLTLTALATVLIASAAFAGTFKPIVVESPLDSVARFQGQLELRTGERAVVLTLHDTAGDHLFQVETSLRTGLPAFFRSNSAEILYWGGHLVVMAPEQGRAWHFSIPGFGSPVNPSPEARRFGAAPDLADLDARLQDRFDFTRVAGVAAIVERGGPLALRIEEPRGLRAILGQEDDVQDPGTGGVGTCGAACTMICGDGSHCSVNCGSNRCAHCSCPASCTCR
jgi:hypothetical protein